MANLEDTVLTVNDRLQLFLMDFEVACKSQQGWKPQEWADKLESLLTDLRLVQLDPDQSLPSIISIASAHENGEFTQSPGDITWYQKHAQNDMLKAGWVKKAKE